MRAAVLGATGFVGRALVPALAEHAEVLAVSRSGPVAADVTKEADVARVLDGVEIGRASCRERV